VAGQAGVAGAAAEGGRRGGCGHGQVCSPARSSWAVLHTIKRHGGRVETTVVLEVDVPRCWLRRSRKGLWFCPRDIPPDRIKRALCFAELAGTSTEA
jgi:hypothetical protein